MKLDTATKEFVVLLNSSEITESISEINKEFFSPNFDVFIVRVSQNSLVCGFPIGISVTVTENSGMLSFTLEMPDEFQNITRGLVGNYNGIKTDDIVYRNGTMLPQNASDRMIHDMGQSCKLISLL